MIWSQQKCGNKFGKERGTMFRNMLHPFVNKFNQKFYGGSCTQGSKQDLLHYEKIGKDSGCFVSSLSKKEGKEITVNKKIIKKYNLL